MKLTSRKLTKLIKEEVGKILKEGTWAAPQTEEKAMELFELFQEPIKLGSQSEDELRRRVPTNSAEEKIGDLIGNDALFDRFGKLRENNYPEDFDVRPIIADFIEDKWHPIDEDDWLDSWSEAGTNVIEYIISNFSTDQDFDRSGQDPYGKTYVN